MVRLSAIFVALCMVLIAGSIGAVLYLSFGFARVEAAVVAVAILTGLALLNAITGRARDRADVGDQIADLSRGTADLARQVAEVGRRLAAVEGNMAGHADKTRASAEPLSGEIALLGTLVKQLADSVAAHETVLAAGLSERPMAISPPVGATPETAQTADRAELGEPEGGPSRPASGRFKGMGRTEIIASIRRAVEASRVDLYLQPIVTLPQRK